MHFILFSSNSFLPRTKIAIESIKKFHPEAKIHLIKLDDNTKPGTYVEGLAKERLKYTRDLILQGNDNVIVFGADCVLYNRLDKFVSIPGDVILTPHVVTPPIEGNSFYLTGHANADLILFKETSLPILSWLLDQPMINEINSGIFYEQTWLSALPFIFDNVGICKDETINYAYFNFHERSLTKENNKYLVNNKPLIMVQYSGFIEGQPEKASRYSSIINTGTNLELFIEYDNNIKRFK